MVERVHAGRERGGDERVYQGTLECREQYGRGTWRVWVPNGVDIQDPDSIEICK